MKSSALTLAVVVVSLALAGSLLGRIAAPAWATARQGQPRLRLEGALPAVGQGVTLALLGGFRTLAADAVWIRMHVQWERGNLTGCETLIRLATVIDPRAVDFWLNGARIMAHDFTFSRMARAGGSNAVPEYVRVQLGTDQGRRAVRHLLAAMQFHPANPALWIERANIELHRLHDLPAAAESYRRACALPGAPHFAARLHAELLRRMGRKTEALDWLARLHPTLPAGDESAGADIVLARIRDLEHELGVPDEQVYRPSHAGGAGRSRRSGG